MSYSEYKFGDFRKYYEGGPSASLVGFAQGFAEGFGPAYREARADFQKQEDQMFKLAIEDIQAQEKRKTAAAKKVSDRANKAAKIAALFPYLPQDQLKAMALKELEAGATASQIISDYREGEKSGRWGVISESGEAEYIDPSQTQQPEPETEVAPDQTSSLDAQTDEALNVRVSSRSTEPTTDMSASDYLVNRARENEGQEVSAEGSVEVADASGNFLQNFQAKLQANRQSNLNTRVARRVEEWKRLTGRTTDVTSASGLTATNTQTKPTVTSEVTVQSNSGAAPVDAAGAAVGTLVLLPKKSEDEAKPVTERIPLKEVNSEADATAALGALALENQSDPEVVAMTEQVTKISKDLAVLPNIGGMNVAELNEFISTAMQNPQYRNIDRSVLAGQITRARTYMADLENAALPQLTFTTSVEGTGILSDITGRGITVSKTYMEQLNSRIQVLKDLEEQKRQSEVVLDEKYIETAGLREWERIKADNENYPTPESKRAALDTWKSTEGAVLLELVRMADKPEKPREFNSVEELAVTELEKSADYQNADADGRRTMIGELQTYLNDLKKNPSYAELVTKYDLMLKSGDPDQVAEAEKWFSSIAPSIEEGLRKKAAATQSPADALKMMIRYTDAEGNTRRAEVTKVDGGYQPIAGGAVIPESSVLGSPRTTENQEYINKLNQTISIEKRNQEEKLAGLIDLSTQAYDLERLAVNDPVVLTLVGSGTASVVGAQREARALVDLITNTAQDDFSKGATLQNNRVNQIVERFIKTNGITGQTADNYRQFSAKLTRFVFAAGKALGQEGNGFSNQDYTNILRSLKAGNGIDGFVQNLRSFVRERSTFVNTGAGILKKNATVTQLQEFGVDLGAATMTFEEASASELAPVNFVEWLSSPLNSLKADKPSVPVLKKGDDNVYRLTTE